MPRNGSPGRYESSSLVSERVQHTYDEVRLILMKCMHSIVPFSPEQNASIDAIFW
jgi:hypothetical protein